MRDVTKEGHEQDDDSNEENEAELEVDCIAHYVDYT